MPTTDMLTAREIQAMLQVDRSTIYRMAEAGRLPAVKVGKQWRFPRDRVDTWLQAQHNNSPLPFASGPEPHPTADSHLSALLPLDCVQLIQDAFAEVLATMLVVTDMDGQPITQVSQPAPFYTLLTESGHRLCQEKWQELSQMPALEPRFTPSWAGLLCARAFVRSENELKGMVIAFGVPPKNWPPDLDTTTHLAQSLGVDRAPLQAAFAATPQLTADQQKRVLVTTQRIADILAHIGNERRKILNQGG